MGRYLQILRRRDVLGPFLAAYLARLPISMAPLGMVLLVQEERGSYASAGAVTGLFAASSAVGAPFWGNLLDRYGQPRVLGPLCAVCGVCLATFAQAVVLGRGTGEIAVLAVVTGATFPPVSAATRVALRSVLCLEADRQAAYALDTVAVETIFMGGPLLLSLLLATPAPVPLLVTAALLIGGGAAYVRTDAARTASAPKNRTHEVRMGNQPLRLPGVRFAVLVCALMAVGFGQCDVSIAATAQETLGHPELVGWLFASIAGGSTVGGLWYGSRPWKGPEHRRLPFALAFFCVGLVGMAAVLGGLWHPGQNVHHIVADVGLETLMPVLFVTGLCISPALLIQANLVEELSPPGRLVEGQAWLTAGFTSGGAAGTALGGWVVEVAGSGRGFLGAACAVLTSVLVAALAQPLWANRTAPGKLTRTGPAQPRTKHRAT